MKQDEIRRKLIDGTIQVIAGEGLDKASTKQISIVTSVNEVYIYRCFANKEDMLAKVFDALDEELLEQTMRHFDLISSARPDIETGSRLYFGEIWKFLLGNRDKCLAYVRYFYSPYFTKYSAQSHEKRFAPLLTRFRKIFRDEADVWMILNHVLNVALDFAVKVHNGLMPKADSYSEHVFRVIYVSVKQYFKSTKESEFFK